MSSKGGGVRVVLPGDILDTSSVKQSEASSETKVKEIKIGPGLDVQGDKAVVRVPGVLQFKKPATFWVESARKKYYPQVGDTVLGLIEDRGGDFYTVNLCCGMHGLLSRLAFDGATKRNKPELKRGDVVYGRVIHSGGLTGDLEISCASPSSTAARKDWSTGETVFGALPPGLLLPISSLTYSRLSRPDCAVLLSLSQHISFELCLGQNLLLYVRTTPGASPKALVILRTALQSVERLDDVQSVELVNQLIRQLD